MWSWLWWFIFGFVAGGLTVCSRNRLKNRGIRFCWYEYLLGIICLGLILFGVEIFFGSLAERETRAAWMTLIFMGVPAVVLITVMVRSIQSRLSRDVSEAEERAE